MDIKSLSYVFFCFVVIVVYFLFQNSKYQKIVLLLADILLINSICGKRGLGVILFITTAVFTIAKWLQVAQGVLRKALLVIGLVFSVGVLIYFKYFTFSYELLMNVLVNQNIYLKELVLPVGLSYYTLSVSQYLVDIYHKKYEAENNYLDFLCFVIYFPAIIEGPINLYKKIIPQIKVNHHFEWNRMVYGLQRILWGYVKKVVIADRIGIIVMGILKEDTTHGYLILLAMIFYSFQIYADFSGGIDVIMGISQILGITMTENFNAPLISKSVTEYWQRWHKSLGEWMEKVIYYPIVLNKKLMRFSKKIKNKYISRAFTATVASIIVFIIVGLWHGTGWNYVVYGLYQAFFVASAVLLKPFYKKMNTVFRINEKCISWRIFCVLRTFFILVIGRFLIKASNLNQATDLFRRLIRFDNIASLFDGSIYNYGLDYKNYLVMTIGILILIVVDILHFNHVAIRTTLMKQDIVFRYAVYFIALFAIIIFGIYGKEYSAASFIYQGF